MKGEVKGKQKSLITYFIEKMLLIRLIRIPHESVVICIHLMRVFWKKKLSVFY